MEVNNSEDEKKNESKVENEAPEEEPLYKKIKALDYELNLNYRETILDELKRRISCEGEFKPNPMTDAFLLSTVKLKKFKIKDFIEKSINKISCKNLRKLVIELYEILRIEYAEVAKFLKIFMEIQKTNNRSNDIKSESNEIVSSGNDEIKSENNEIVSTENEIVSSGNEIVSSNNDIKSEGNEIVSSENDENNRISCSNYSGKSTEEEFVKNEPVIMSGKAKLIHSLIKMKNQDILKIEQIIENLSRVINEGQEIGFYIDSELKLIDQI